tara:strand:- start:2275 stop:2499 length:225 start_codon:yes stop_codon:yes gene_type:complete
MQVAVHVPVDNSVIATPLDSVDSIRPATAVNTSLLGRPLQAIECVARTCVAVPMALLEPEHIAQITVPTNAPLA